MTTFWTWAGATHHAAPMRTLLLVLAACLATVLAADAPPRPRAVIATSKGDITVELYPDECPQTVANFLALAEGTKPFVDSTGQTVTRPFYDGLIFHRVIDGFMIQGGCPKGDGSGGPGFVFADEINADALGLDKARLIENDDFNRLIQYQAQDAMRLVVWPRMQELGITNQTPPAERAKLMAQVMEKIKGYSLKEFYFKLGYRYDDKLPSSHQPVRGSLAMANSGPNTNGSQFFINLGDTPHLAGKHTVFGAVVAGMEVVDAIGKVETTAQNRPTTDVVIRSIRAVKAEVPKTAVATP